MTGTDLTRPTTQSQINAIARRYRKAGGPGIQVLNLLGGQAETLLDRLPDSVKQQLDQATTRGLGIAMRAARDSRDVVGDQASWLNTAVTTGLGAAGGFGGLPSALAEVPVTTTVLLRAIQGIAAEHGFDPQDDTISAECLAVFSAAGPLADDDGADMGFLAARLSLTGPVVQGMIARVAPRLSIVLGQKLAAQAVPIMGAAVGAATNYAYTSYYQDMAHVQFGLMRLSEDSQMPRPQLILALKEEMDRLRAR